MNTPTDLEPLTNHHFADRASQPGRVLVLDGEHDVLFGEPVVRPLARAIVDALGERR